jgi:hypothetical protein
MSRKLLAATYPVDTGENHPLSLSAKCDATDDEIFEQFRKLGFEIPSDADAQKKWISDETKKGFLMILNQEEAAKECEFASVSKYTIGGAWIYTDYYANMWYVIIMDKIPAAAPAAPAAAAAAKPEDDADVKPGEKRRRTGERQSGDVAKDEKPEDDE